MRKALIAVAVAFCSTSVPALAGTFSGGIVVQGETFDPQHPNAQPSYTTLYANSGIVTSEIRRAWSSNADAICAAISGAISKPGAIERGQDLYDIKCSMGDSSNAQFGASSIPGGIHLAFVVPGNYLEFTSTQPTVCDKKCDPRFSVNYDARVDLDVVPGSATSVSVKNAAAHAQNPTVDSHGVVADIIVNFAKTLRSDLGGPDFLGSVQSQISSQSVNVTNMVNGNLITLNALLGGFASQGGYTSLALSLANAPMSNVPPASVLVELNRETFGVNLTGAGTISGAVRWDSAAGNPTAACNGLQVQAKAATGYKQQGQFVAPQSIVGHASFTQMSKNGSIFECAYVISGVPYNVPLEIDSSVSGPWTGPEAYNVKRPMPDGWSGNATVTRPTGLHMAPVRVALENPGLTRTAPQPIPRPATPGRLAAVPLRTSFVTVTRPNPQGAGSVGGIDFAIEFEQAPR